MNDGRKRISHVIAGLGIATLGGSMLTIAPSYADPDIDDVQARVDTLYHEAEQASERYNLVREELTRNRSRLQSLKSDLTRQRDKVDVVRDQVAASVVAESQGQTLSSTSQVLLSEDPDDFLSQLSTISAFNDQQNQMMALFATQVDRLAKRELKAQRRVAEIAESEDRLAAEKAEIDAKAADAESLLDELEAEERARLEALKAARVEAARAEAARVEAARDEAARDEVARAEAARAEAARDEAARDEAAQSPSRNVQRAPVSAPSVAASGNGAAAVEFALAQVGDAYVYGAAGPDAWDCSGLTMAAWQAAGISLPHQSQMQMSQGTPVAISELQPGDIVAYYSPISHVGMYIGNGQLVHAANPSSPVEIVPVDSMPISSAVRTG